MFIYVLFFFFKETACTATFKKDNTLGLMSSVSFKRPGGMGVQSD